MGMLAPLYIYSFQDIGEILLVSSLLYYCTRWLLTHKHYRLLLHAYGYMTIYTVAYMLNLNALLFLLQAGLPAFGSILVLSYQKNIFSLKSATNKIKPASVDTFDTWSEILIRLLYLQAQEAKTIKCYIEGKNNIEHLFEQGLELNTYLSDKVFHLLQESKFLKDQTYLCIQHDGTIKLVNAVINELEIDTSTSENLLTTADCMFIELDLKSRLFTVQLKKNSYVGLTGEQLKSSIGHFIKTVTLPPFMKVAHDNKSSIENTYK